MRYRDLCRGIGYLALSCAVLVGGIHALAIRDAAPSAGMSVVLWTLPVLIPTAFAYILAARQAPADITPPRWAVILWTIAIMYAGVNFSLERRATAGGTVEITDRGPVLMVHGRAVRFLTPPEVRDIEAWKVRGLSGHLLPFFILPGVGLLVLTKKAKRRGFEPHAA